MIVNRSEDVLIAMATANSSSDEEDDFMSAFESYMSLMPPASRAELLIVSSGDEQRLETWKSIGPCFRALQ